ncbi:MAG: hypothetical protein O7I93_16350 [Gemmatimonadetes bacterium]|nr:hypothetical protein [Gemmatimonadota bacterium]
MSTSLFKSKIFQRYLLPGFVFQSIIIAGGYGTGRELAEFFLRFSPLGGVLGMTLIATVSISVVGAVTFEFARVFHTYDYRSFFVQLLGKGWVLYEIGYLAAVLLILGVIGSAVGTMLSESFGLPYVVGVAGMMLAVGFLVFKGTATVEYFLATWSLVLYATYVVLFFWSIRAFGGEMATGLSSHAPESGWALGGLTYGVLQVSLIPAVLFTMRHIETRREAVGAGLLAGVIAMVPALLFLLAMAGHYPEIVERPIPVNFLLETLGSRAFQVWFQIVLFGTLIETGTGLIHAFNERVAGVLQDRGRDMPAMARPVIAVALLLTGAALSAFGIVALVGRGYTSIAWWFLAIYVVPILTLGIRKLRRVGAH